MALGCTPQHISPVEPPPKRSKHTPGERATHGFHGEVEETVGGAETVELERGKSLAPHSCGDLLHHGRAAQTRHWPAGRRAGGGLLIPRGMAGVGACMRRA